MQNINKKQSVLISFLAGALIAASSVYLSKKENRDELGDKIDHMKTDVLTKSQKVTHKLKNAAQQLHVTTVEKASQANKRIQDKAEKLQKTAVELHQSLEENTENKELKEF